MRDTDARNIISASLAGEIRPLPGKHALLPLLVTLLACHSQLAARAADRSTAPAAKAVSSTPRTAFPAIANALLIRGTVVDENGAILPNIKVAAVEGLGHTPDFLTQSDAAGKFRFNLPERYAVSLVASDASGERMGFVGFYDLSDRRGRPLQLVMRKSRVIAVTVVDGKAQPVAGARVLAAFYLASPHLAPRQLIEQPTDPRGKALLRIPSDMPLTYVFAVKAGAGFDYVLYQRRPVGRFANRGRRLKAIDPHQRPPEDNQPIDFVLSGTHKVRIHLVDGRRRPLPGVRLQTLILERPNKGGPAVLYGAPGLDVLSDQAGIAEFEAIPADATMPVTLITPTMGYNLYAPVTFNAADPVTDLTVVARPLPVLRVQVSWPDGRPATGARLDYTWRTYFARSIGRLNGSERLYDGANPMDVVSFTSDAYCVVAATSDGFTSTTEARVARMDEPMRPVHLVLRPAVHVHGTLTWGKEHHPDTFDAVTLIERDVDQYSKLPDEERLPRTHPLADLAHVAIDLPRHATTDEQGRFDFEVPPGRYLIGAGTVYLNDESEKAQDIADLFDETPREFEIKDQKEIEINFEREDLSSPQSGATVRPRGLDRIRLQVTYADGRPAPEARTQFTLCPLAGHGTTIGNSIVGRSHIPIFRDAYCVVSATSDGFASAIASRVARKGQPVEPVHLILKPAARVHGRITVGTDRLPASNVRFLVIQRGEEHDSKPPAIERPPEGRANPKSPTSVDISISHATNRRGRFEFYAAPGRYVLVPDKLTAGRGNDLPDLQTLIKNGAKEFEVKDEKDIEINVRLE